MKHLALLASVYALIAALVLPSSIFAQEEAAPAEAAPAETATTPAEPAPPAEAAPAEPAPAAPAPAEPAPEPEPRFLADESKEAPKPEPKPKAVAAASGSVTVSDFTFAPGTITINQGDTVTWVNNGPTPHSATSSNGAFDTGIFPKGQSRSHTFNEAGTFAYICTPHPFMKGTVVVQASQTEGSSGSGDTGGATDTGATAAQEDDGPTLPNTGSDAAALLILGGLMVLLGIAVRRRSVEPG